VRVQVDSEPLPLCTWIVWLTLAVTPPAWLWRRPCYDSCAEDNALWRSLSIASACRTMTAFSVFPCLHVTVAVCLVVSRMVANTVNYAQVVTAMLIACRTGLSTSHRWRVHYVSQHADTYQLNDCLMICDRCHFLWLSCLETHKNAVVCLAYDLRTVHNVT